MARSKNPRPRQLTLLLDAEPAPMPRGPARSVDHQRGFLAWCEREEEKRAVCEPILRLHAAGVAFVAIVVARALAKEVV